MSDDLLVLRAILHRLNVLISLQLEVLSESPTTSIAARIRKLAELGLAPAEIGAILGKKANYISAVVGGKGKASRE